MTFRIMLRFYVKNLDTLKKARKFALRFLNTENLTLCVKQFFIEFHLYI